MSLHQLDLFLPTKGASETVAERWTRTVNSHHLAQQLELPVVNFTPPILVDKACNHIVAYFEGAHRRFHEEFGNLTVGFTWLYHALRLLDDLLVKLERVEAQYDIDADLENVFIDIKDQQLRILLNKMSLRSGEKQGQTTTHKLIIFYQKLVIDAVGKMAEQALSKTFVGGDAKEVHRQFAADPKNALQLYREYLTPKAFHEVIRWDVLPPYTTEFAHYFRHLMDRLLEDRNSAIHDSIPSRLTPAATWKLWQKILDAKREKALVFPKEFEIDLRKFIQKLEGRGRSLVKVNTIVKASQPQKIFDEAAAMIANFLDRTY